TIELGVQRDGVDHHIQVKLGDALRRFVSSTPSGMPYTDSTVAFRMANVTYHADDMSWTVGDVTSTDTAHAVGLRPGDLITAVEGLAISDENRARLMALTITEDTMAMTVLRDEETLSLNVPALVVRVMLMEAVPTRVALD
ncbi:MAG: PDZ domain-containing protein, partial [Chloroflexota bacterium]